MALGVKVNIVAKDIRDVKMLSAGIFLLRGVGEDELVLKGESVTPETAKRAQSIMKTVDAPPSGCKVLSETEVAELLLWSITVEAIGAYCGVDVSVSTIHATGVMRTSILRQLQDKQRAGDRKYCILKMVRQDLKIRGNVLGVDESVVENFRDALTAEGGLEQQGREAPSDFVIGNDDRFRAEPRMDPQSEKENTRVVRSRHNVFLSCRGGPVFYISGLDFMRAGADLVFDEGARSGFSKSSLETLKDRPKRRRFAEAAVLDLAGMILETVFAQGNSLQAGKAAFACDNAPGRVVTGMIAGCQAIGAKMVDKSRKGAVVGGGAGFGELARVLVNIS